MFLTYIEQIKNMIVKCQESMTVNFMSQTFEIRFKVEREEKYCEEDLASKGIFPCKVVDFHKRDFQVQ